MSLLIKALKHAERPLDGSPKPRTEPAGAPGEGLGPGAGAAALFEAKTHSRRSLWATAIGLLFIGIVVGGVYVYQQTRTSTRFTIAPQHTAQPSAPAPLAAEPFPAQPLEAEGMTSPTAAPLPAPLEPPTDRMPATSQGKNRSQEPVTSGTIHEMPPTFARVSPPSPPAPAPERLQPDSPAPSPTPRKVAVMPTVQATTPPPSAASRAHLALGRGDLAEAKSAYESVLTSDPHNVDALLGLATIAAKQGDLDTAGRRYMKVLEIDPQNANAHAGLLNLVAGQDPAAAELRLKALIQSHPSAQAYFSLGNVYARQQRWLPAEQAYFEAARLMPDNPDYAFNLAVSLEHIGQGQTALHQYRRALELVRKRPGAGFNPEQVQQRIRALSMDDASTNGK